MTIFLHTGWCRDFYCIIVIFFKSVPLIRVTSLKIAMCTLQFAVFFDVCAAWNGYGKGGGRSRKLCDRKGRFRARKDENWFSARLPHLGERKKLVARILKSEPLILKSKPLIFCPLKTRPETGAKKADNNGGGNKNPAAVVFLKACWLFYA